MIVKIVIITSILFAFSLHAQTTISFLATAPIGNDMRSPAFDEYVARNGYAYFFSKVKSVLEADDYTVANLENDNHRLRQAGRKGISLFGESQTT